MCYYITKGDIYMIISKWPNECRIPTIPREVLRQIVEGGAAHTETQPPQIPVPKKQRMSQTKFTQADDGLEQ
jgi:hypothetical protein